MPLDNFKELIDNLTAFDFGQEMETIVSDNLDKLPPMIRDQLAEGKDGDDKPNTIFGRSGYSPKTVAIKQANGKGLGAVTDRITNYMSGDTYESLVVNMDGETYEADSDVPYFGDIVLYSSPALLEVDEDHRREFGETITLPAITDALLTKTGLKITNGQ